HTQPSNTTYHRLCFPVNSLRTSGIVRLSDHHTVHRPDPPPAHHTTLTAPQPHPLFHNRPASRYSGFHVILLPPPADAGVRFHPHQMRRIQIFQRQDSNNQTHLRDIPSMDGLFPAYLVFLLVAFVALSTTPTPLSCLGIRSFVRAPFSIPVISARVMYLAFVLVKAVFLSLLLNKLFQHVAYFPFLF